MATMKNQIELLDRILKFNTQTSILGQMPTKEEIAEIKEVCKEFKGYNFNTDVDDLEFIKQLAEFGNSAVITRK